MRTLREATGHPYGGKAADEPDVWYDFDGNVIGTSDDAIDVSSDDGEEKGDPPKLLLPAWEQVQVVNPPRSDFSAGQSHILQGLRGGAGGLLAPDFSAGQNHILQARRAAARQGPSQAQGC